MKIYLEQVELINYRSCKKTKIALNQHLSALIGANGSGKSNILNGILLLKKIAQSYMNRNRLNEDPLLSDCKLKALFNIDGKSVKYEALIKHSTNERNTDEVANAEEKWNFKEVTGQGRWFRFPLSLVGEFSRNFGRPISTINDRDRQMWLFGFPHLDNKGTGLKDWKVISSILELVVEFITGINYYSASRFTDPSKCPTSIELEGDRLARRVPRPGEEHLMFMYDLYYAFKTNKGEFNEFLSLVNNEGISLVDNIEYDEINVPSSVYKVVAGGRVIQKELKKLLVIPNIIIRGIKLSPNQLSEGTFKTLAILFYIITDKSRILLLEEPEVCIHHGLLASILEIIKTFSQRKQIIISTHSDFVLDALDPAHVFIVKNEAGKGTIVKHVPSSMPAREYKALKDYLDNFGNLGEYWRHGELEK